MLKNKEKFLFVLVTVIVIFTLAGCGGKPRPEGMPRLYPCTIRIVDQNDNPLSGVLVAIASDDPEFRWNASGSTNDSGIAVMQTLGEYRGVAAGSYKVVVSQLVAVPTGQFDPEEGYEIVEVNNLLKPIYSTPLTTPLTIEVGTRATNVTLQVETIQ